MVLVLIPVHLKGSDPLSTINLMILRVLTSSSATQSSLWRAAANGVIKITTKKGKEDVYHVNISSNVKTRKTIINS